MGLRTGGVPRPLGDCESQIPANVVILSAVKVVMLSSIQVVILSEERRSRTKSKDPVSSAAGTRVLIFLYGHLHSSARTRSAHETIAVASASIP